MLNLWLRMMGVERLRGLFIEGEGGGEGGGGGTPSSEGGGGGGGGTPSNASPGGGGGTETAAPGTSVSSGGGAPIATQERTSTLVDDGGKPVRELGESSDSFLARFRDYRTKHPDATEEKKPEPAKPAAQPTTEQKPTTETAKPAEQKPPTEEKKPEGQEAAVELDDDDLAPISTEDLSKAVREHPAETEAFLKATGLTQDQLFANSRLASRAAKYMKLYPTEEAAAHAHTRAKAFHALDQAFTSIKPRDVDSTRAFLNETLLPLSYLRNEDGSVKVDEQTKMPLTDGSVFTFLDNVFSVRTDFLASQVEKLGGENGIAMVTQNPDVARVLEAISKAAAKIGGDRGEQLQLAADLLKACGKAGPTSGEGELSEDVKRQLAEAKTTKDEADRRQRALDEQETAGTQKKISDFKDGVLKESSAGIDKVINDLLDRTSLKEDKFLRETVLGKIRSGLYQNMSEDSLYNSQRDEITMGGLNQKTHQGWLALNLREAKARLKGIADPILAEAGAKKIGRAQERRETIAAQEKRSTPEPKGGTTTSLPAVQTTDKHELLKQARENLRQRGEEPSTDALMKEFRKLQTAVPA